jgi:hypothetical protein
MALGGIFLAAGIGAFLFFQRPAYLQTRVSQPVAPHEESAHMASDEPQVVEVIVNEHNLLESVDCINEAKRCFETCASGSEETRLLCGSACQATYDFCVIKK